MEPELAPGWEIDMGALRNSFGPSIQVFLVGEFTIFRMVLCTSPSIELAIVRDNLN